ncbi:MAG TPA: alpha/beta hydrolase [Pirellulales bacterium]|nr:alpha/beta hydrolase [Pirellulales bacterium]
MQDQLRISQGRRFIARPVRFGAVVAFWLSLVGSPATATEIPYALQGSGPGCIDDWIVSAHQLTCCGDAAEAVEQLQIWHREPGGWVRYGYSAFIAAIASDVPVTIYIHGIFATVESATRESDNLFRKVGAGLPPFRGIVWLWPSDYQFGVSFRDQVDRALAHGQLQAACLATIIRSVELSTPVNLVGHSLGCDIVGATLHRLATAGIGVTDCTRRRMLQALLLAPTIERCSLWPGGEFSGALSQVDRLLVTYNPEDVALLAYEQIHQGAALGLHGLPPPTQPEQALKLLQINAHPAVGVRHTPYVYFESPLVAPLLRSFLSDPIVADVRPAVRRSADRTCTSSPAVIAVVGSDWPR